MIATTLSAFSSRATRDRRSVLVVYSMLIAVAMLGLAHVVAVGDVRGRIDGVALADVLALIVLGASLFVLAPSMVAAQVAEERRQGTLDLLRTAPLSPTALTMGFLLGAPGGLYLLLTGTYGVHVLAMLLGRCSLAMFVLSTAILGLGCVVMMLVAIVASLSLKRDGAGGTAPLVLIATLALTGIVAMCMAGGSSSAPWALVHPAGILTLLVEAGPMRVVSSTTWSLDYVQSPLVLAMVGAEPVFAVVLYAALAWLLLSAARRVLASDPPSRLEKPEALGLFGIAAIAILGPLRATTLPSELQVDAVASSLFALFPVYLMCVLGATPSGSARALHLHDKRLSPHGAPLLVGALMIALAMGLLVALFGASTIATLFDGELRLRAIAYVLVALTIPLYSLFAATRITATPSRLAFWALIVIHVWMQLVAMIFVTQLEPSEHVPMVLARADVAFGVLLPLYIAWRQRVGDRRL